MAEAADLLRTIRPRRLDALRSRIRARRLTARVAVVGAIVAAFAAGTVSGGMTDRPVTAARSPTLTEVPVAVRDLPYGHTITDDDVILRSMPVDAILGRAAVDVSGRVIASPVHRGELVTEDRLADGGRLGLADGEVAIGVVPPLAPIPVEVGDVVALVAVGADPLGGAAATSLGRARVVAVDEGAVTVAVAEALGPVVLEAQAVGSVELTLTPWTS